MANTVRQVALLRGINVGRAKRVGMAELRALLQHLGYTEVRTHLNSGNAVFTCPAGAAGTAASVIERGMASKLGVEAKVILRSHDELAAAVAADPLLDIATDPARHLVGFLAGEPSADGRRAVAELDVAPDQARLIGREVFLWCPSGVSDSPLIKVAWEKLLGVAVTSRNWNTVLKLVELTGP